MHDQIAARRHLACLCCYSWLRHDVEAMQERARLLQEEAVDNRGAEMNRHLYVLSILTAVLMPATLMVSLFGVNTGGLPLLHSERGFVVVAALAVLSSGLVFWLFHRMREASPLVVASWRPACCG